MNKPFYRILSGIMIFVLMAIALPVQHVQATGSLFISEVAPWSSSNGSTIAADWFEVTNTSGSAVNITGWKMDDNSNAFASSVPMSGITSIAAGESVIFIESTTGNPTATVIANFKSVWFNGNPPAGLQIGTYQGSGVGLSGTADAVNLFDSGGTLQANVSFGVSPTVAPFTTFDNAGGLNNQSISQASAIGVNGAFAALNDSTEIGSPGTIANPTTPTSTLTPTSTETFTSTPTLVDTPTDTLTPSITDTATETATATPSPTVTETSTATETPTATTTSTPSAVIISEVAPWSSSNSPFLADWFEITNIGGSAVNITGWKMDDDSHNFSSAVVLNGISSIAPGESVIFIESAAPGTVIPAFKTAWFDVNPPAGLQVGTYTGSGVGLSSSGDGVNIYNASGVLQASVSFNASPSSAPFGTFDNSVGLNNGTIAQLSVVGVNGAFAAANDVNEIGSPGLRANLPTPTPVATDTATATATITNTPIFTPTNTVTPTMTATPLPTPLANNDSYTTTEDATLDVTTAQGVLSNDDGAGAPLNVVANTTPSHGTLTLNPNGSLRYVPAAGYTGPDSFTYTASNAVQLFNTNLAPLGTFGGISVGNDGYGSALAMVPGSSDEIYGLTDRGPNVDGPGGSKIEPDPSFAPAIGKFHLVNGQAILEQIITLQAADGTPYNGHVNTSASTGETMTDLNGNAIPADVFGYDSEGLVALADDTFWVSDEYGPLLTHFDATGKQIERVSPYDSTLPAELQNRIVNKGMEGLTITPDGTTLVGIMQSALQQVDLAGANAKKIVPLRIVTYKLSNGETHEYLYMLDNPGTTGTAVSELTALTNTTFLIDERDGNFLPGAYKKLYRIDISSATDIGPASTVSGATYNGASGGLLITGKTIELLVNSQNTATATTTLASHGITPVSKTLYLDVAALLTTLDPQARFFNHDKMEGLVALNGGSQVIISNDSDFGIDGITNAGAPFQLHVKTIPTTGRQDFGEYLSIDLNRLPATLTSATVNITVATAPTATPTETAISTDTATPTETATLTLTPTLIASPSGTFTPTETATNTATATLTDTETFTPTPMNTATFTPTATYTATQMPTRTETRTPTKTRTPSIITVVLTSIAAQDGSVLETSESSGMGGAINSTAKTFNLGDNASKKQYRGILSFNTGSIPDNATILSVTLKIKKSAIVGGGNPVSIFKGFMADLKGGTFGLSTLQAADFQTLATPTGGTYGPFVIAPINNIYSLNLTAGRFNINKLAAYNGLTQIRLRFKLDDNNNLIANYLSLFSSDTTTPANRPQLVITYSIP